MASFRDETLEAAMATVRQAVELARVLRSQAGIRTQTTAFRLVEANEVLEMLRTGQILGAAVLEP